MIGSKAFNWSAVFVDWNEWHFESGLTRGGRTYQRRRTFNALRQMFELAKGETFFVEYDVARNVELVRRAPGVPKAVALAVGFVSEEDDRSSLWICLCSMFLLWVDGHPCETAEGAEEGAEEGDVGRRAGP